MSPSDEATQGPEPTGEPTGDPIGEPTGDPTGEPTGEATGAPAAGSQPFAIGAEVDGTDGHLGRLDRVIVDPIARALTHLVVAPKHHLDLGRLVPIELVEDAAPERIRVRSSKAEFDQLDAAEDVQFLPAGGDWAGYGSDVMTWPYYGLGAPLSGIPEQQGGPIYLDRIPKGDVEVTRGEPVHASDGWIGSIQGLVVDPKDHHVTHVLLKEGHLWGRKQVAIPIGAITRVGDEIRVGLTKQQVEELPPVDLTTP